MHVIFKFIFKKSNHYKKWLINIGLEIFTVIHKLKGKSFISKMEYQLATRQYRHLPPTFLMQSAFEKDEKGTTSLGWVNKSY